MRHGGIGVSDSPEQVRLQVLLAVENFIATEVGACERIIEMMSFRRVNAGIFRRDERLATSRRLTLVDTDTAMGDFQVLTKDRRSSRRGARPASTWREV